MVTHSADLGKIGVQIKCHLRKKIRMKTRKKKDRKRGRRNAWKKKEGEIGEPVEKTEKD